MDRILDHNMITNVSYMGGLPYFQTL
jgi:hypothetical protein